jgi:2'-5' RNA ligase
MPAEHNEWRVFCAIDLPQSARLCLIEHIGVLRRLVPQVQASWSRETNLHLTLKFVGEIQRNSVREFSNAVSRAVKGIAPFSVVLEGVGVFPNRRDPRVLWLGITDPGGRLADLHSRVETECFAVGFPKEERPFHPHLTLARLRTRGNAGALARAHEQLNFEAHSIEVAELLVIRSELSSAGSKYTVVSRHALNQTDFGVV